MCVFEVFIWFNDLLKLVSRPSHEFRSRVSLCYVYTDVCVCVCVFVCLFVCRFICLYVCMYVYIYMYIHTCMYVYV